MVPYTPASGSYHGLFSSHATPFMSLGLTRDCAIDFDNGLFHVGPITDAKLHMILRRLRFTRR